MHATRRGRGRPRDRVYKRCVRILDSGPCPRRPPASMLKAPMADPSRRSPAARSASEDPLMREVRWRLFRHDELPARLRRLERLERAAAAEERRNGDAPPGPHPAGDR